MRILSFLSHVVGGFVLGVISWFALYSSYAMLLGATIMGRSPDVREALASILAIPQYVLLLPLSIFGLPHNDAGIILFFVAVPFYGLIGSLVGLYVYAHGWKAFTRWFIQGGRR